MAQNISFPFTIYSVYSQYALSTLGARCSTLGARCSTLGKRFFSETWWFSWCVCSCLSIFLRLYSMIFSVTDKNMESFCYWLSTLITVDIYSIVTYYLYANTTLGTIYSSYPSDITWRLVGDIFTKTLKKA